MPRLYLVPLLKNPTGTLLTWETTNPPELKENKKHTPEMGAVKLILDGQQRITTIYMIMKGVIPPYYTQEDIRNDVRNLYVNILSLDLEYYKQQQMATNPAWQSLTQIFQNQVRSSMVRKAMSKTGELDEELEDRIDRNFEAVKAVQDRDFPEQIIPINADINEAIDIFYVVNASGVNLTDAELALAHICGYWPQARDLFKSRLTKLRAVGFDLKLDFIVYALLGILHSVGSDMKRLHGSGNLPTIKAAWNRLDTQILDYLVNLLRTHAYVDHSDEINSHFALIPLIKYIFNKPSGKLTEDDIKRAVKWFYYSQLRQRYVSQTPQRLDKDLGLIESSESPFDEMVALIGAERPLEITPEEFVGRDVRHPLFSLMRWYFKSRNAVCLGTGVGLRQNMGAKYALEYDHIFPYSALRDNGYPVENKFKYAFAQELTNRAILTAVENRSKSASAAYDYLTAAMSNFPGALEKQCIPKDVELWKIENFEKFLDQRRMLLTEALNAFLTGITETKPAEALLSIEDMISEGEHEELEFKSSLRLDTEQSCLNKALEGVALKSIAAFNNTQGGRLLIGVRDDGQVLGLEPDYGTLGGDRDLFERHLRNLVNSAWGKDYGATLLKTAFPKVEGVDICVVTVKKGSRPLYLEVADKHGKKTETFFVRSGNSSTPIDSVSEVASYVAARFAVN